MSNEMALYVDGESIKCDEETLKGVAEMLDCDRKMVKDDEGALKGEGNDFNKNEVVKVPLGALIGDEYVLRGDVVAWRGVEGRRKKCYMAKQMR